MSTCAMRFDYDTLPELEEKLVRFLTRRGYEVRRAVAPMIEVGELAVLLGRKTNAVSRSLHRASCPDFTAIYGQGPCRRRILRLRTNPKLLEYLDCRGTGWRDTPLAIPEQKPVTKTP